MTHPPPIQSRPARRSAPRPPRRTGGRQLLDAVRAALHTLDGRPDLYPDDPGADDVWRTRMAQYLRVVLAMLPSHDPGRSGPYGEAIAAVTAACSDLDGGDLPGAYLALRAASTALQEAPTA